jgi:hypothetical protein
MATTISFKYDGEDYTLEYTRESVKRMEDQGFAPSKILEAPVSYLPELFRGAFIAHHRYVKRKVIDEIFEKIQGKSELVNTLIEMYNEPINALTEETDEGNGIEWTRG